MNLFNYTPDKNIERNLFCYSKYFQNKLDINFFYCYSKYLEAIGFDLNDYLYEDEEYYQKGILSKEYNNFLSKNQLNKNKFEKVLYEVINTKDEMNREEREEYINIDSPLFEI